MKTYSAVLDALTRSIDNTSTGYLSHPTQIEVGTARAHPDRFVLIDNRPQPYPYRIYTRESYAKHFPAPAATPPLTSYAAAMRELAPGTDASYWLKTAARTLDLRDALDAHNDATALVDLQTLRLRDLKFPMVDPKWLAPNGLESFAEVLVDLAFNAGHELGQTGTRINEDSRAVVQTLMAWATEFERAHLGVQWGADDAPDYIEAVDGFYITKRSAR